MAFIRGYDNRECNIHIPNDNKSGASLILTLSITDKHYATINDPVNK